MTIRTIIDRTTTCRTKRATTAVTAIALEVNKNNSREANLFVCDFTTDTHDKARKAVKISQPQARAFAMSIVGDIAGYIDANRPEYDAWVEEGMSL